MKSIISVRLALSAALLLALSAGCHKRIDKTPDTSSLCSIQWVTTPLFEERTDTLRFSYDDHGNPTTISRNEVSQAGNSDFTFWYDHEHRATDVIETFALPVTSGIGFNFWDKLYYTGDRVTLDSSFAYGIIDGARPKGLDNGMPRLVRVSHYQYDAKGRITRATDIGEGGVTKEQSFTYNGQGNLVRFMQVGYHSLPNPHNDTIIVQFSTYDNKINVDRTNPIWQFLDRNYSVNNRFVADAYNEAWLPTAIPQRSEPLDEPISRYQELGFLQVFDPLTIQYNCQLSGPGNGHGY